ncbi:MAG TPA: von Willebrand factor type A domain-containing protein [Gemmataceae bacterium]|nr:von Willebrand factor type A domain-containing protein [Gemmataceae bacterium]
MDERPNPLEERPFVGELGDGLRDAVERMRTQPPPAASLSRAMDRARRLGPGKVNPWVRYHRMATTAAVAAVLLLTFGLLLLCWRYDPNGSSPRAGGRAAPGAADDGANDVAVGLDSPWGRLHSGAGDAPRAASPFVDVEHSPVSSFPLSVDPTAYRDLRRALLDEQRLPAPDSVRTADLVNSFAYSYPEPSGDDAVSLTLDLAECPWDAAHQLARIGLRARSNAEAREVQVRVTFNPRRVAAYRLIGSEGRRSLAASAVETLGAGRAVTALYEIVPAGHGDDGDWLTAEIRCRIRTGQAGVAAGRLTGAARRFADAPEDFRFAAAAAEFGLLLSGAMHGDADYAAVKATARAALGADPDGRRAEFLALVAAADGLTTQRKVT